VKALRAAGHSPVVLDDLRTGHRWAVGDSLLVVGRVGERPLRAIVEHGIEAVMHFAASAYVRDSLVDPRSYFVNNVVEGLALLNATVDAGVRLFVQSSSCAVFGAHAGPIAESAPRAPINPYGASKHFFEEALAAYDRAYDLRSVCLRYFNAAGADPEGELGEVHEPETHLIPNAMRAALGVDPSLPVFGDGSAVRDFVHVTDLADAHVRALHYLMAGGSSTSFNLGTGAGTSVREIVEAVSRVAGLVVPTETRPASVGDPPSLVADGARARAVLNWAPAHSSVEEIVATAWAWERGRKKRSG
jgi:UDP-glucose-4-epimerase GalE